MDKLMELKFLMFENEKNNCWLDASVALIAHNKTIKKIVSCSPKSQILKIITTFDKAISVLNDSDSNIEQRMKRTREMLVDIQKSTLKYLQQFLKYKVGEPDSAHCAVLNLIYQDKSDIKEHLNASCLWEKKCTNCDINPKSASFVKPIITLSKVTTFQPECPTSIYMCSCKTEQEMKLIYKELPTCLIFHFENGAGNGTKIPLMFKVKEREYQLTAVVTLEKSNDPNLNHFITYIRDPFHNIWLDCNDLNTSIVSFSSQVPEFNLKDVYMYVFESFDSLGKLSNGNFADQEQNIENLNVEIIDLSDEAEEAKNASENYLHKTTPLKLCKDINTVTPKEAASMFKETKKSAVLTNQDLKGNENRLDTNNNKETVRPIDYSSMPVRNFQFTAPGSIMHAIKPASEWKSYLKSIKDVLKEEEKKVDINNVISSGDNVNTSDGKEEKHFRNKTCTTKKDILRIEKNENKNTAVKSLGIEHQSENPDDCPKVSDKPASSDIARLDLKEDFSSEKRPWIHNAEKDCNLVKSEVSSGRKSEKESAKNKLKQLLKSAASKTNALTELEDKQKKCPNFHKTESQPKTETILCGDSKYRVKTIRQTLIEQSREGISSGMNSEVSPRPSTNMTSNIAKNRKSSHEKSSNKKHSPQSTKASGNDTAEIEAEENGTCDYENELQLKMEHALLKRLKNQSPSSRKKRQVVNTDEENSNKKSDDINVSEMSMQKLPEMTSKSKCRESSPQHPKKTYGTQLSSSKNWDSKNTNKDKTKQRSKMLLADDDENEISSCDEKATTDQTLEQLVNTVVEQTFAVLVQDVIIEKQQGWCYNI